MSLKKRNNMDVCGVTYDTKIHTKNKGDVQISSVCGETLFIWTGYSWSDVLVLKIAQDQKIMKIHLNDGSIVSCCYKHPWFVKHGYNSRSIPAHELKINIAIDDYYKDSDRSIFSNVSVTDIEYMKELQSVYCFHEPKRGRCVFNGVMTGTCSN